MEDKRPTSRAVGAAGGTTESSTEAPAEEMTGGLADPLIEEVSIDGMCGVY